jgi:hypothetical protein
VPTGRLSRMTCCQLNRARILNILPHLADDVLSPLVVHPEKLIT